MAPREKRAAAIAAAGLMIITALFAAPIARAYPPGTKTVVTTNKVAIKPGKAIKARGENVQPGCRVTFTFKGGSFKKQKHAKANSKGVAKAKLKHGPKKAGKYKIVIRVEGGHGCQPARNKTGFKVAKSQHGTG